MSRVGDFFTGGGSGGMLKAIYDTDNNDIVDSAEQVSGVDTAGVYQYYGTDAVGTVGFFGIEDVVNAVLDARAFEDYGLITEDVSDELDYGSIV